MRVSMKQIASALRLVFHCSQRSYVVMRPLQRSQYGGLLLCVGVRDEGSGWEFDFPYEYACLKVEDKQRVLAGAQKEQCDNAFRDRALLRHFAERGHPCVLRLLECLHCHNFLYCVLEYAALGDLTEYICAAPERGGVMQEHEARLVMRGAGAALEALHALGWCHRDVSPENIVLMQEGLAPRLLDFGGSLKMTREGSVAPAASGGGGGGSGGGGGGGGALGEPLAGWLAFPPTAAAAGVKLDYACPHYLHSKPWWGVEFDIFSFGGTLFFLLFGERLGFSRVHLLKASDALLSARFGGGAALQGLKSGESKGGGGRGGSAAKGLYTLEDEDGAFDLPSLHTPGAAASAAPASALAYFPQGLTELEKLLLEMNQRRSPPVSQSALCLLSLLLRYNPAYRPHSFSDVLSQPWFREG
jgi:serine/threonine protein kinase